MGPTVGASAIQRGRPMESTTCSQVSWWFQLAQFRLTSLRSLFSRRLSAGAVAAGDAQADFSRPHWQASCAEVQRRWQRFVYTLKSTVDPDGHYLTQRTEIAICFWPWG
jgi:hypothetical protein